MARSGSFYFLQVTVSQNCFTIKFTISQIDVGFITKWASVISKWDRHYKVWLVLQSRANYITKLGRYYKFGS